MIRRLAIASAILTLAAPLTPATAATPPTAWNYRSCVVFDGIAVEGVVCLKAAIRRQADGTGTVVGRVHPYAYTRSLRGPTIESCGNGFDNPTAVTTYKAELRGYRSNGTVNAGIWRRTSPNLTDSNNCSRFYYPAARVNAAGTGVVFYFRAHRPGYSDVNAHLSIRVDADSWGCGGAAEYCGRNPA